MKKLYLLVDENLFSLKMQDSSAWDEVKGEMIFKAGCTNAGEWKKTQAAAKRKLVRDTWENFLSQLLAENQINFCCCQSGVISLKISSLDLQLLYCWVLHRVLIAKTFKAPLKENPALSRDAESL